MAKSVAVDFRRSSHQLFLFGSLLVVVSAFLPWFETHGLTMSDRVRPALSSWFGAATWVVLIAVAIGLVVFVLTGSPAVVGCVAALWFNSALFIWFVGARASLLVPGKLFPSRALARLGDGGSFALAGGLLVVIGATVVLFEEARGREVSYLPRWSTIVAFVLLIVCVTLRQFNWFEVRAGDFRADVDVDLLPILGDAMSLATFVAIALLIVQVVVPRWWIALPLLLTGLAMALISLIGWLGSWAIERAGAAVVKRLEFAESADVVVTSTNGSVYTLVVALVIVGFSVVMILTTTRPASADPVGRTPPPPTVRRPTVLDDDLPF